MSDLYKPVMIENESAKLKELLNNKQISVIDDLDNQLTEYKEVTGSAVSDEGVWFYYPWKFTLVRVLSCANFRKVRQSRNRNLITEDEQAQVQSLSVAVAGLNVGNPAAICMVLESVGQNLRFADFDELSLSNLNRFRAGLPELGLNKAMLSARQAYEIDPYLEIDVWDQGIKPGEEDRFLDGVDVLIEEMDNLPLKISIRESAKKLGKPVVMVTGNESDVIIDIERFDLDKSQPLLNGYLKDEVVAKTVSPPATMAEKVLLARDFMGKEFLTKRLNESFLEVGKSLPGIPQLAESSFLRGAAVCYAVRRIATDSAGTPSGRYTLKLSEII